MKSLKEYIGQPFPVFQTFNHSLYTSNPEEMIIRIINSEKSSEKSERTIEMGPYEGIMDGELLLRYIKAKISSGEQYKKNLMEMFPTLTDSRNISLRHVQPELIRKFFAPHSLEALIEPVPFRNIQHGNLIVYTREFWKNQNYKNQIYYTSPVKKEMTYSRVWL